jgi:hypothetical protein
MPGDKHLKGKQYTAKDQRQYEHILESTGSKSEAAATVNKFKAKKKRRG